MALDLRVKRQDENLLLPSTSSSSSSSSLSSSTSKQVLNVPIVSTVPKLTLPSSDLLPALPMTLGIPLTYPPSSLFSTQSSLGGDSLTSLNIQPLSVAEENAIQRELIKLKDNWTKHRTEMAAPRSRRFDGARGVGWTTVGDVNVPYIMRGPSKYVSTKIVEAKLLSTLQGVNLEKMSHAGPLYSYYITEQEARLFTEINNRCYNQQFGPDPFTTQDLIVSLTEFERFYMNMRKQCTVKQEATREDSCSPGSSSPPMVPIPPLIQDFNDTSIEGVEGGWLQINNTVVPYVFRNGVKFVPLCVIKYAAGLLTDVRIDGYKTPCTEMEYQYLNSSCRQLGVNFLFLKSTKFIKLELVIRLSNWKVTIKELASDDPFTQASYQHNARESATLPFPLCSSPDLAPNQNPALFQIPCPLSLASSVSLDSFPMINAPITAIASHALQFFNAAAAAGSANLLLPCFPSELRPMTSSPASSCSSVSPKSSTSPKSSCVSPKTSSVSPKISSVSAKTSVSSAASTSSITTPSTSATAATDTSAPVIVIAPTTTNTPSSSPSAAPSKILSDPAKKMPTFSKRSGRAACSSTASSSSARFSQHLNNENNYPPPPPPAQPSQPHLGQILGQPHKIVIECKEFQSRTLPCLLRGGVPENSFVLVESVMRLYFPEVGIEQFVDILQAVMDVTVVHLRSVEEQAFIRFYSLPVKAMRYKYMMLFQDLKRTYYPLKEYFKSGLLQKDSSFEQWSTGKGKSLTNGHSNKRKAKSLPKLISKNIKLETGDSPVCYVMDNALVGGHHLVDRMDTDSSSCSGSDSEESVNLQEERSALMTAYTDTEKDVTTDTKAHRWNLNSVDISPKNKVIKTDGESEKVDIVKEAERTSGDNQDKESQSSSQGRAQDNDSDSEEKIDVESTDGCNKENHVDIDMANTDNTDNKESDKNRNEAESAEDTDSPMQKRSDDSDDSSAVSENRNKVAAAPVKKLESALAKLKQRQQEKLVSVDETSNQS